VHGWFLEPRDSEGTSVSRVKNGEITPHDAMQSIPFWSLARPTLPGSHIHKDAIRAETGRSIFEHRRVDRRKSRRGIELKLRILIWTKERELVRKPTTGFRVALI
jgi:hypothetical protein